MSTYRYRVVPAPSKGLKTKGIKGPEARFSNTIEELMNQIGSEGWEYQRAEMLPSVERSGLTGSTTEWRNVLVFRKPRDLDDHAPLAVSNQSVSTTSDAHEAPDGDHLDGSGDGAQIPSENIAKAASEAAEMTDTLKS